MNDMQRQPTEAEIREYKIWEKRALDMHKELAFAKLRGDLPAMQELLPKMQVLLQSIEAVKERVEKGERDVQG